MRSYRSGPRAVALALLVLSLLPALSAQESWLAAPGTTRSLDFYVCEHGITVDVLDAWPGAAPQSYTLVRHDDPVPEAPLVDAVIRVPARRIVSLATPVLAHLEALDAAGRLVGIDSGDYVYSAEIRRRVANGEITELGAGAQLDLERLIALQPDVVLMSVYAPDDPTLARIRAAGIPVVVFADWREADPLARAEWVRLVGLLVERDRTARRIMDTRRGAYAELRERVADALEADGGPRPTVMTNAPWQGSWPVPAGESYMARLLADAGARYLWAETEGSGSVFLDLEAVLGRAADADLWINGNAGWRSLADLRASDPRLTAFAPYRRATVYHYNRRVRDSGANDFWESGATRPDLLLADLVRILHPGILPDHELVYYRRLTR